MVVGKGMAIREGGGWDSGVNMGTVHSSYVAKLLTLPIQYVIGSQDAIEHLCG